MNRLRTHWLPSHFNLHKIIRALSSPYMVIKPTVKQFLGKAYKQAELCLCYPTEIKVHVNDYVSLYLYMSLCVGVYLGYYRSRRPVPYRAKQNVQSAICAPWENTNDCIIFSNSSPSTSKCYSYASI